MKRKRKRQLRSNSNRIKRRLRIGSIAASPVRLIDPATVTVNIPVATESVIEPWWIELPIDQAFWRVWRMNSLRMRQDGYKVYKIGGRWRAFLVKPPKWHQARGRAG